MLTPRYLLCVISYLLLKVSGCILPNEALCCEFSAFVFDNFIASIRVVLCSVVELSVVYLMRYMEGETGMSLAAAMLLRWSRLG
jgi:hypothetical protein